MSKNILFNGIEVLIVNVLDNFSVILNYPFQNMFRRDFFQCPIS
jgi:hypothetical protein